MKYSKLWLLASWSIGVSSMSTSTSMNGMIDTNSPPEGVPPRFHPDLGQGFRTIIPLEYNVSIYAPEPGAKKFKGMVTIKLRAATDADNITLHIARLGISSLNLDSVSDNTTDSGTNGALNHLDVLTDTEHQPLYGQNIKSSSVTDRYLNIEPYEPIKENGTYQLSIAYEGVVSLGDRAGLVLSRNNHDEDQSLYTLYTVIGPRDAPRVFPCMDDPSYRTPFTFQMIHGSNQRVVFGNNDLETEEINLENDKIATIFEKSPSIATHQFSFALLSGYTFLKDRYSRIQVNTYTTNSDYELGHDHTDAMDIMFEVISYLERFFASEFPLKRLSVLLAPKLTTATMAMPTWGFLILDSSTNLTSISSIIHLSYKIIDHWIDWSAHYSSPKFYWTIEALSAWMAYHVAQRLRRHVELSDFVSFLDKQNVMALDLLGGRRNIMNPLDKYTPAFVAKGRIFMAMIEEIIGSHHMLVSVKLFFQAVKNSSVGEVFDYISSDPISNIIDGWTHFGGLPVVSITNRTDDKITVSLSIQSVRGGNNIVPVYVDLYLGYGLHQKVLLTEAMTTIKLKTINAPFVFIDPTSIYAYYKPTYSREYLKTLAVAGKTDIMSKDDKTKLLESLEDDPTSILFLAQEWKSHGPSRIPIVKALHSMSDNHVKGKKYIRRAILNFQIELVEMEMKELGLQDLQFESNYTSLPGLVYNWDERRLAAYNETCVLGILKYRESCVFLVDQFLIYEPFPESLSFGALKTVVKDSTFESDTVQSILSLAYSSDLMWYVRVSSVRALGANSNSKSANKTIAVLDKLSQVDWVLEPGNNQSAVFTQMLETMQVNPPVCLRLWKWIKINWEGKIKNNSLLRHSVMDSGIGQTTRVGFKNSVCRFFSSKDLTLQEKISINHDILMTTQKIVTTFTELPKMREFLRSHGYLTAKKIVNKTTTMEASKKKTKRELAGGAKFEGPSPKYGKPIVCQIPLI